MAGLLVEIPEEAGQQTQEAPPAASGPSMDEIDALIARASAPIGQGRKTKTVEQIVRESEGPNLDEIKVTAAVPPPVVGPNGRADFAHIYEQAGVPRQQFTAEQLLDMIAELPANLPLDTKRQMVKVSLNAMGKTLGATPETIVADASRKLAAINAYKEDCSKQTADIVARTEKEIADLQNRIEEKRREMARAKQNMMQITEICEAEADRLDDVLEFLSLDTPPSKYATETKQK
jgi:gas vesicle protein